MGRVFGIPNRIGETGGEEEAEDHEKVEDHENGTGIAAKEMNSPFVGWTSMRFPYRFGRYTLLERIASGGTAEIFRAILYAEEGFSKVVAVKRLLPGFAENSELERMLIDEGRVLARLQHAAIVQVMELSRFEGVPFLAMEFVDGIDGARLVMQAVRDRESLPIPHALYIAGQLLLALDFAHRQIDAEGRPLGIVHRDISPSNILLSWNGEVKVTDFGIAKGRHRSDETQAGQLRGKYAYMAPEQARGEELDARADLFACGVLLFELVAARRLFQGKDDLESLELVRRADVPAEALAVLPPELRSILLLALAPSRDLRYRSAAEMHGDLCRAANVHGGAISCLEFAGFLRGRFPREPLAAPFEPIPERKTAQAAPTRLLSLEPARPPGISSRRAERLLAAALRPFDGLRVRHTQGAALRRAQGAARAAGFAAVLAFIAAMPPAPAVDAEGAVEDGVVVETKGACLAPASAGRDECLAPASLAPASAGSAAKGFAPAAVGRGEIAIESFPAGARGMLRLGADRQSITTPFSLREIEMGEGIDGEISLRAPGFKEIREGFRLEPGRPAFVKRLDLPREVRATISVHARPWGLVDVDGLVAGRETPVRGLKVGAGSHLVRVRHPPTEGKVQARVVVVDGEDRRCIASFEGAPSLRCR